MQGHHCSYNDAQRFIVLTDLKSSGTANCSLPFLLCMKRNNASFIAQISEYILTMFLLCEYLQQIHNMWENSDDLNCNTCKYVRVSK